MDSLTSSVSSIPHVVKNVPVRKYNGNHHAFHNPQLKNFEQLSRETSRQIFGDPSDNVLVRVNDFCDFFKNDIDDKLDFSDKLDVDAAQKLLCLFPFARNFFDHIIEEPPNLDYLAPEEMLQVSRQYRLQSPMLDRLSKYSTTAIGSDSTRLKFHLGIETAGCIHVGAGKIYASSVPDAGRFIDWQMGSDFKHIDIPPDCLLVSDASVPSLDGLGAGSYPELANFINDVADRGNPILAKVIHGDLERILHPYHVLCKPRPHNLEFIISINIPGVSLSMENLLSQLRQDNDRRNDAVFEQRLPLPSDELYDSLDEDLLSDDKDYSSLLNGVDASVIEKPLCNNKVNNEVCDPQKLASYIDNGYFYCQRDVNNIELQIGSSSMASELARYKGTYQREKTEGFESSYRYVPKYTDPALYSDEHLIFRIGIRGPILPIHYPIAMWIDNLKKKTVEGIALVINVLTMTGKDTVTLMRKAKVLNIKNLKKPWLDPGLHRLSMAVK